MNAGASVDALSFVVAVHNVGQHVEATLDSLLAAALPADEIIVIDDGSRDDTAARVAAHPAAGTGQVTLIRQPNQGVATTRLNGLARASRPYVLFFDGDDLLQAEQLQPVRAALRKHAPDVVLYDFDFFWTSPQLRSQRSPMRSHPPRTLLHDPEAWLRQAYDDAMSALWSRVVRRSLYDAVLPVHCPRWSVYEDLAASPHVLAAARSLVYLPVTVVKYRQRSDSLSTVRSLDACENLVRSALHAAEARAALPASRGVSDAAWCMVARKLVEAVRRAGEAGARADEIHGRLLQPALHAMGPDLGLAIRRLQASQRFGDRRIAQHLAHIARWPRLYAAFRAAMGKHKARRRA